MAVISKWYTFEAAHQLEGHDGHCANLHGHSYQVCILLQGQVQFKEYRDRAAAEITPPQFPKEGFVLDYADIDKEVAPIIQELDHSDLNVVVGQFCRTTAENIACYIWHILTLFNGQVAPRLFSVHVKETAKSEASISSSDYVRWKQHYLS